MKPGTGKTKRMVTTWTRGVDEDREEKLQPKSEPAVPAVPQKLVDGVRAAFDDFEGSLRKSLSKAIALGKALIALKEKCAHSDFGKHFTEDGRPGVFPFRHNWANKIMRVACNEAVSNCSHENNLPADLNTVYELSLMAAPALEAAIEEGKVTPQTTRAQAKEIRREADPEPKAHKVAVVERDPAREIIAAFAKWEDWLIAFLDEFPKQKARARSLAKALLKHTEGDA